MNHEILEKLQGLLEVEKELRRTYLGTKIIVEMEIQDDEFHEEGIYYEITTRLANALEDKLYDVFYNKLFKEIGERKEDTYVEPDDSGDDDEEQVVFFSGISEIVVRLEWKNKGKYIEFEIILISFNINPLSDIEINILHALNEEEEEE